MKPYLLFTALFSLLLSACASQNTSAPDATAEGRSVGLADTFCDSYFIYSMCARDVDQDGLADLMYFEDSNEIFMQTDAVATRTASVTQEGIPEEWGENLSVHECVQTMDEELQTAASALFSITEQTGSLRKTQIKSRLILSYSRYMGRINRCNNGHLAMPHSEDSFGDSDYEDL